MKKDNFPLILLVLTACGEKKEVQPAEEATAIAVVENVTDSIQVDAITSATSKPNQVSFNGTMVIPPQRMATVSLRWGVIKEYFFAARRTSPTRECIGYSGKSRLYNFTTDISGQSCRLNFWKQNIFANKLFLSNKLPPKETSAKGRLPFNEEPCRSGSCSRNYWKLDLKSY